MNHGGSNVVVTVLFWVFFVLALIGCGWFVGMPDRRYYGGLGGIILLLVGLLGYVVFHF